MSETTNGRYGAHGRALVVDLSTGEHTAEEVPEQVYRQFLGGYGLGAWLMWKHFPPGTDALAPEACFAIARVCSPG
jgi:aldehyde:ferredoxin oxidoreductase